MFSYIFYRIGQTIALNLPLKFAYALAILLSDLRFLFARQDRLNVAANLKVIFPEKSDKEIRKISIRLFRNFAKYLVDFFRFDKIDIDYIKKNIKLENLHYLDSGFKEGKGVIILTAHLGNWELGGVATSMSGYPFITVALPHKSKKVNEFFNKQRENKGIKVFPLGNAAKPLLRTLRKNGLSALVGDRDFSGKGMLVEFFGKPTIFPLGPAVLSLQTQAKIVPGFTLRKADDSFEVVFNKPLEFNVSGNHQEDIKEVITKYKQVFEEYIRLYPDQWFVFRKFWGE